MMMIMDVMTLKSDLNEPDKPNNIFNGDNSERANNEQVISKISRHNTNSQLGFWKICHMSHGRSQIFSPVTFMTVHNIHRSHLPWTMASSQRQLRTSRVNLPAVCNISQSLCKLSMGIITQKSDSRWFQIYRTIFNICLYFSRLSWKRTERMTIP